MKALHLRIAAGIWVLIFLYFTYRYWMIKWTWGAGALALGFLGAVFLEWLARAEREKETTQEPPRPLKQKRSQGSFTVYKR